MKQGKSRSIVMESHVTQVAATIEKESASAAFHKTRFVRCSVSSVAYVGAIIEGTSMLATLTQRVAGQIRALRPHLKEKPLPFTIKGSYARAHGRRRRRRRPVPTDEDRRDRAGGRYALTSLTDSLVSTKTGEDQSVAENFALAATRSAPTDAYFLPRLRSQRRRSDLGRSANHRSRLRSARTSRSQACGSDFRRGSSNVQAPRPQIA